ncbi:MAG TPA: ribosome maturation factor RimM [Actinomycetota bacterium]|nr:ribosome maturation factor RimM [Actinomycetota bacterium]
MPAPARLVVGRVLRPHGVRGEVLVEVLSDAPERFSPGEAVAAGDPESGGPLRPLEVAGARIHQGRMLVRFAGVSDRDEAQRLRGNLLSVPMEAARELGEDEFWRHQLVGLSVVDPEGNHRGEVADVLPGAAHDLFQVRRPDGVEVLVPAVAALVRVELEAGRIVVQDIPGLLDPDGPA